MAQLSADKLERVEALLTTLPRVLVDRLCSIAEQADPPLGKLLTLCRDGIETRAKERFFAPLAPVSGDPETDRPSRSFTPKSLQALIWDWLKIGVAPQLVQQVIDRVADPDAYDSPGALDTVRVSAAEAILAELQAVSEDARASQQLLAELALENFDALQRAAVILKISPHVRGALDGLPVQIGDMSEALSATIRDRYETASEAEPDAAIWVLYFVMARMDKPWKLLRVFERIARRDDDLLVSQTDMAVIGDALLKDAEHALGGFAIAPERADSARAAAEALMRFASITVGMTREIGIRKDGEWGKHLFEVRSRASEQMVRIHTAARDAFKRATPEGGGLKVRVKTPPSPGDPAFERAEALGAFLIMTKDDASRAAVGNAHAEVITEIRERLESVSQDHLDSLRGAEDEEADAARMRLLEIAQLMEAIGQADSAAVLLRRVAAARAA